MTPLAWLALAGALALVVGGTPARPRLASLVGAGRLTGPRTSVRRARTFRPELGARRLGGAAAALLSAVVLLVGGPVLAAAAAAVGATGWLVASDAVRGRESRSRRGQLLAALRVLIGELEAGARAFAALTAAAELAPAYAGVFERAASAAAAAHDAGAVLCTDPDTRAAGLAWRLGEDTGAALAGVLTRVAADLADAEEQRRTVGVALAGPRSSAALLTGLPVVGIGLGAAMGARPWEFLLGSPAGRIVCCVGVVLDAAGVLWMRRILRRAERP
jgi:tight adherence protein B